MRSFLGEYMLAGDEPCRIIAISDDGVFLHYCRQDGTVYYIRLDGYPLKIMTEVRQFNIYLDRSIGEIWEHTKFIAEKCGLLLDDAKRELKKPDVLFQLPGLYSAKRAYQTVEVYGSQFPKCYFVIKRNEVFVQRSDS